MSVDERKKLSADQLYDSLTQERLDCMRHGGLVVSTIVGLEFGVAGLIGAVLALQAQSGPMDTLYVLPSASKWFGFGMLVLAFLMPVFGQVALLRSVRRYDLARHWQKDLLQQAGLPMPSNSRLDDLDLSRHNTGLHAQSLLGFCCAISLFVLFLWCRSSHGTMLVGIREWPTWAAFAYCAVLWVHLRMWYRRCVSRHRILDFSLDRPDSAWLLGLWNWRSKTWKPEYWRFWRKVNLNGEDNGINMPRSYVGIVPAITLVVFLVFTLLSCGTHPQLTTAKAKCTVLVGYRTPPLAYITLRTSHRIRRESQAWLQVRREGQDESPREIHLQRNTLWEIPDALLPGMEFRIVSDSRALTDWSKPVHGIKSGSVVHLDVSQK